MLVPEDSSVPVKGLEDDSRSGGNCSYDADASNDSIELNLSLHEDPDHRKKETHENHPHQYSNHLTNATQLKIVNNSATTIEVTVDAREAATRGTTPFIPISEETIFLDTDHVDPVTSSGISTMSSPMSCDSWMNYSSNSSDDLSCISDRIHVQQDSSEESSLEFDSPLSTAQSTPKIKCNFNNTILGTSGEGATTYHEGVRRKSYTVASKTKQTKSAATTAFLSDKTKSAENITNIDDDVCGAQTKRLRGKSSKPTAISGPSSSGSFKRKAVNRNNSISNAICDIRMIDFAHTTFVRKKGEIQLSTPTGTVQHQGPDNGFLRGIESLKRLLNEILDDNDGK